jgi:hypothetical protein
VRICLISFGANWWSTHSPDLADPLCFRRRAAWFNSAGLMYGRRLRLSWVFPGQIRFNSNSGFNPEYPRRALGQVFESAGPVRMHGKMNLLLNRSKDQDARADRFLVTLNLESHGQIVFSSPSWRSSAAQPISVSLREPRYEAMMLIGQYDWLRTDLGVWMISNDHARLELVDTDSRSAQ